MGMGFGLRLGLSHPVASASSSGTAFPQTGAMIARWRADDMPVVADGTQVSSWTDSIGGAAVTQATGANKPVYKVTRYGGKPSVLFSGNQRLNATIAAINTAINAKEITIMAIFANPLATTNGLLFAGTSSTNVQMQSNGTYTGSLAGPSRIPYQPAGFATATYSYTQGYNGLGARGPLYVNGSCVGIAATIAAGSSFTIGDNSAGAAACKAEILEVIVWNRRLTQLEVIQAEKAARDYYSQPYPWTAPGYFYCAIGDSISFGYGCSNGTTGVITKSWPYLQAQRQSLPPGAWSNIGVVGIVPTQASAIISGEGLTGISALTGVPTKFSYFEFFNQRADALATQVANTQEVLSALKANGVDKVVFGTATDYANRTSAKTNYTGYWDTAGNRTGYMDGYVAMHTDTNVGVDGACPNAAPYGAYFSNTISTNAIVTATLTNGSTTMSVTAVTSGTVVVNQVVAMSGAGIPAGTYVTVSAGGGTGDYTLSAAFTGTTGSYSSISCNLGDGIHPGDGGHAAMAPLWDAIGTV